MDFAKYNEDDYDIYDKQMYEDLIGERVLHRGRGRTGTIVGIKKINEIYRIEVEFYEETRVFNFPESLANHLMLENKDLEAKYRNAATDSAFEAFKEKYRKAICEEVNYLRREGGKVYKAVDGRRLSHGKLGYMYSFEVDSELNFPSGLSLKIRQPLHFIDATVVECNDFQIIFRTEEKLEEDIDEKVRIIEFTAEQWRILESFIEQIDTLRPGIDSIAYKLACEGNKQIDKSRRMATGQDTAIVTASRQPITFIWGPPGTGKTHTLAKIAEGCIEDGKKVLMVSYSNVSVDGALLRVAERISCEPGKIIRYGYPRNQKLVDGDFQELTSYKCTLIKYPELDRQHKYLTKEREEHRSAINKYKKKIDKITSDKEKLEVAYKKSCSGISANEFVQKIKQYEIEMERASTLLNRYDEEYLNIVEELKHIKNKLAESEKKLVQSANFVATTVSKAVMDKTIYEQKFDTVIFDEASMAYIPHVVFAGSLARNNFICLGDFEQLPAIVQSGEDNYLNEDIFQYVGITEAVQNRWSHKWLVMLDLQYRMHPEISDFASERMYDGNLHTAPGVVNQRAYTSKCDIFKKQSMRLVDLSYMYSVCTKTMDGSYINPLSAFVCIRLAQEFAIDNSVGIISPYSAQARLILAMIRDLRERGDISFKNVTSATVHQFQGSEESIILFDTVDCYRRAYIGYMLTNRKRNIADRLLNVAITRAQHKFIMVSNRQFFKKKHLSEKLLLSKLFDKIQSKQCVVAGEKAMTVWEKIKKDASGILAAEKEETWDAFLDDIEKAERKIRIDIPGMIDDDDDYLEELVESLDVARDKGVSIQLRVGLGVRIPRVLNKYRQSQNEENISEKEEYVTTPVTFIDNIVWYGHPLSNADFITGDGNITTKYFPTFRLEGEHTAKILRETLR